MTDSLHPRIISFGEILYDIYPKGAKLGGAPLNLAVHLSRLGANVEMISAVGRDHYGAEAVYCTASHEVGAEYIARVLEPTGTVVVEFDENKEPSYSFAENCAYDHIPFPKLKNMNADLFCFGTLAQRSFRSRDTLRLLLDHVCAPTFLDVNLRQNFYTKDILEESLWAANYVKLNEMELEIIADIFGLERTNEELAQYFKIEMVILTLGSRGCEIYYKGKSVKLPACETEVVSTVGAGDAFSAAFMYGFITGKDIEECAKNGNELAAKVAGMAGSF